MYIVRTSSAAAAAAARLRLDLAPVDVLHPLLVVRGLHEGCASEAGLLVLVALVALLVDGDGGGVRETRMAKAVSSGETSMSRPKNVTWELY